MLSWVSIWRVDRHRWNRVGDGRCQGGELQAERTACAKALRWGGALCFGGAKRPLSQEGSATGGSGQGTEAASWSR